MVSVITARFSFSCIYMYLLCISSLILCFLFPFCCSFYYLQFFVISIFYNGMNITVKTITSHEIWQYINHDYSCNTDTLSWPYLQMAGSRQQSFIDLSSLCVRTLPSTFYSRPGMDPQLPRPLILHQLHVLVPIVPFNQVTILFTQKMERSWWKRDTLWRLIINIM